MKGIKKIFTFNEIAEYINKGGLRKVADFKPPCMHPEHTPPNMIVLEPGIYEYTCPACGETTRFTVPLITY